MIFGPDSAWERRAASKWEDVRQLALGMLWLVRRGAAAPPHPPPRRHPVTPPPRRRSAATPPPRRPGPPCPAWRTAPSQPLPPTPTPAPTPTARRLHRLRAQSAGLHLSRLVGRGPSSGAAQWWGAVQWGPLRANLLGLLVLVLMRGARLPPPARRQPARPVGSPALASPLASWDIPRPPQLPPPLP